MIKAVFLVSMMAVLHENFFLKEKCKVQWWKSYFKNYNSYDSFYHKAFLNSHSTSLIGFIAEAWALLGQRREK